MRTDNSVVRRDELRNALHCALRAATQPTPNPPTFPNWLKQMIVERLVEMSPSTCYSQTDGWCFLTSSSGRMAPVAANDRVPCGNPSRTCLALDLFTLPTTICHRMRATFIDAFRCMMNGDKSICSDPPPVGPVKKPRKVARASS